VTVLAAAVVVFLAIRAGQVNGIGGHIPIIGGGLQTFTREDTTQVSLSTITQVQVCDKIGNVSIKVDQTASTVSVTTKKIVHVDNQADANQEFQRIAVEAQPPGTITNPLTCSRPQPTATPASTADTGTPTPSTGGNGSSALTVNITLPNSDGLLHANSDAVDIAITLPPSVVQASGPTMLLNVEAPVGNITVDGLSGIFTIRGSTGDIDVSHAILASGSELRTTQGNVTFNGLLAASPDIKAAATYHIGSEQGTIDVTLPDTINVILDANVNVGKINSEFDIPMKSSDGGVTYHGPLNTTVTPASTATLSLDVSSGTINIHKTQT